MLPPVGAPLQPTCTEPPPVNASTMTLASMPWNTALAFTFKLDLLSVQCSLALLPPTKVPCCTSINAPIDMLKVPDPKAQATVPLPVFFKVPAPVMVLVGKSNVPDVTLNSAVAPDEMS